MPVFHVSQPKYLDREEAGKVLASRLSEYKNQEVRVLAIPNGGVPVAIPIAKELRAELYLMILKKLQVPDNPEAGFGSITSDGLILLNHKLIKRLGISQEDMDKQKHKALSIIHSRQQLFGKWARLPSLIQSIVILVDDGLASGFTMEAAVSAVQQRGAREIVVAVPTSSMSAYKGLEPKVNRVICPNLGRGRIFAVADAYQDWYDLSEEEVLMLLTDFSKESLRFLPHH